MDAPIFIVGANRSGTTLLRLILNAHSRIAIPDELLYITSYLDNRGIEQWKDLDISLSHYRNFVNRFLERNDEALSPLDLEALADHIVTSTSPNFRSPYQMALEAWARHHGKERWGEKTPSNIFYAETIMEMFPDAQFIHLIRDPRAGVASMQDVWFFSNDPVFNALNRKKYLTVGQSTLEKHVPASQRRVVRYEDLVRNPASVVQSLCTFLDEPFESHMLEFYRDSEQYMKDEAAESFNKAATRPISSDNIDKWKHQLSPSAIAKIESLCRDEMQRHGYSLTEYRLTVIASLMVFIKRLYWNIQDWRNSHIRHYVVRYPMLHRTRQRIQELFDRMMKRLHPHEA
jgi:hypothetical protein